MADNDHNRGYRPRSQTPSGDPLAELARLIGQQNESAPSYRQNGARTPYGSQPDADQGWAAPDPFTPDDGYRQGTDAPQWKPSYSDNPAVTPGASGHSQYDPRYDQTATYPESGHFAARYPSRSDPRHADAHDPARSYPDTGYADQHDSDRHYGDSRYGAAHYNDLRADAPYTDPRHADPRYADPRYDEGGAQDYGESRYGDPNIGLPPSQYGQPSFAPAAHGYPDSVSDQGHPAYAYQGGGQPYGDAHYVPPSVAAGSPDRKKPTPQRGSIVTVLAVFALAVVGTAAAFGYRAMFGGGGTAVPPPVIKADTRPSKVVPATDPNAKPIQDRVGVKTERVVPREEEPVQQAAPGQPRVIAPWLAGQNPQAFPPATASVAQPAGAPAQSNAPQPGASRPAAEPKRVRTVPIKPEQSSEAPSPRNARNAAAIPAVQPESDPPHSGGSAPLALSPAAAPQRQAARQPNPTVTHATSAGAAFPTPIPSSAGSPVAAGPYAVQVTSQRSEADAQASFRSLQQQFPAVLGNRQPVIRRADLGDKGTYYRAQIPFSSQNEASEFCSSLKAAGGQCVVQRN